MDSGGGGGGGGGFGRWDRSDWDKHDTTDLRSVTNLSILFMTRQHLSRSLQACANTVPGERERDAYLFGKAQNMNMVSVIKQQQQKTRTLLLNMLSIESYVSVSRRLPQHPPAQCRRQRTAPQWTPGEMITMILTDLKRK